MKNNIESYEKKKVKDVLGYRIISVSNQCLLKDDPDRGDRNYCDYVEYGEKQCFHFHPYSVFVCQKHYQILADSFKKG